ncbi:TrmH family RNA methyltransferase [Aquibacillus sediminis]|uniref:TrmH family RNA methyltransferase n=1 Tax=Aquibacillus sediminis TaxID=2574734 RepID=UPI0011081ACA|nr:RNA methyltransferase [Aquibacillus sediminis]
MITSVQNNKVKQWNKLKKRKDRNNTKTFLVEGYHLIQEAINSNWHLQEVIIQEGATVPDWLADYELTYVSDHVLKAITDTKTPQGIAAVVEMKQPEWADFNQLLLVDAVQDPGNLGTMIRTADAAGFDGVVLGEGTVDLFNDKVVRATQGSLFHLPIFQASLEEKMVTLQDQGFEIWAATLEGAKPYPSLHVPDKVALIVGNEGAGIASSIVQSADQKVHIPIYGAAESLNVSVATGILLYHLASSRN